MAKRSPGKSDPKITGLVSLDQLLGCIYLALVSWETMVIRNALRSE